MFSTYRSLAAVCLVLFGFVLFPGGAAAFSCHDLDGAILTSNDFQIPHTKT